jgi:hypothetical protein
MKAPIAVAAVVASMLGAAGVSQAQVPAGDSVTGSGTASVFSFVLDAHSGPSGENPTGTAETSLTTFPSVFARGPVTCLTVQGDRAVIGIANEPGSVGAGTLIEVTDDPDTLVFSLTAAPPTTCTDVDGDPSPVESGDIAITDAPALPTTKDQCRNGGWTSFGGFKNQGDCISFVATGGRRPPGGASNA